MADATSTLLGGLAAFSAKGTMSQAAMDLGMGDQLKQQLEDEVVNRKKAGVNMSQTDMNSTSPAVLALYGKINGFGT